MKLLVATERTQGAAHNDYTWCVPGEPVWLPMVCDDDRRDPRGGCGCGRGFGGLASHRATTTAEVVERDISEEELRLAVVTSLTDQGWLWEGMPADLREGLVGEVLGDLQIVTGHFRVGAVVRRAVDQLYEWPA